MKRIIRVIDKKWRLRLALNRAVADLSIIKVLRNTDVVQRLPVFSLKAVSARSRLREYYRTLIYYEGSKKINQAGLIKMKRIEYIKTCCLCITGKAWFIAAYSCSLEIQFNFQMNAFDFFPAEIILDAISLFSYLFANA